MKRLIPFLLLLCSASALATTPAPICLGMDVLSGPATGGEGGNGTYTAVYGLNFTGATSVTVNGTAAAQILYNGADLTGRFQMIGIQIAAATTGTNVAVQVTTPGGTCQFSTASLTGFTVTSGIGTFSYTGPQLLAGQQFAHIDGFTTTDGITLNGWPIVVSASGLTSSSFQAYVGNGLASTFGPVSDTGTVSNGGFTVASGNIWYYGTGVDDDTPGSNCTTILNGTAGGGAGGNGSYATPFKFTDHVNIDMQENAYPSVAGSGYSNTTNVAYTPLTGSMCTTPSFKISTAGGGITSAVTTGPTATCSLGDTFSITGGGGTGGVLTLNGISQGAYSYSTQRTPQTYYECMSPGDTVVLLDSFQFLYGSGKSPDYYSSWLQDRGITGFTIQNRPDGLKTAQMGSQYVNRGCFNNGSSSGDFNATFARFNCQGSGNGGTGLQMSTPPAGGTPPVNPRAFGMYIRCDSCDGAAGAFGGGNEAVPPTSPNDTANAVADFNEVDQVGCLTPSGKSIKEHHDMYFGGNGIDVGWNTVNGQCLSGPNTGGAGSTACYQNNYGQDTAGGFYGLYTHDNFFTYCNGPGIVMDAVDPSQAAPIIVRDNVIVHSGIANASDQSTDNDGIFFAGDARNAGPGTVYIVGNTLYDTAGILNTVSGGSGAGAQASGIRVAGGTFDNPQLNMSAYVADNIVVQPAYTYSSTTTGCLTLNELGTTGGTFTGTNNMMYSFAACQSGYTTLPLTMGTINNPQFVNTAVGPWTYYALQSTSPAIGAASTTIYSPTDFTGALRIVPSSIGAIEFNTGLTPTLTTITVTPSPVSIQVGNVQQYAAQCGYSDGSNSTCTSNVTWESTNTAAATINSSGTALALGAGQSTIISATWKGIESNNATLMVQSRPSSFWTTAPCLQGCVIH